MKTTPPTPEQIEKQQSQMLQSAIDKEIAKRKRKEKQTLYGLILALLLASAVGYAKYNQSDSPIKPETIECKN